MFGLPSKLLRSCVVLLGLTSVASADPFGLVSVEQIAREMARKPHVPPTRVSQPYLDLTYDTYRLIAQRHENALWRNEDLATWMEFFPAGFLFEYPVRIHVVDGDKITDVEYSDQWFQFRGNSEPLAKVPGGGFAGLRFMSLLPGNEQKTEFLTFLGASYFRGIGAGQWYGASARGLAIDIGLGSPEEFPRFLEFWVERPKPDSPQRMWALLESPGVVGAYEFTIRSGEETKVGVSARVWRRHGVQKLALAPLTSMFMWNPETQPADDPRPSVHDSDGLLIHRDDNEWVWRDLTRPEKPQVESWPVQNLRGFGLMQRDRDPEHYKDDEAHYHQRPSVWVETGAQNPWGPGRIELLELDAKHEGVDNIGAYFVIDQNADLAESIAFNYELTFGTAMPWGHQVAPVIESRVREGLGHLRVKFEVPERMQANLEGLVAGTRCSHGKISSVDVAWTDDSTIEVTLRYQPDEAQEARVEVWLEKETKKVSEVYSYRWKTGKEKLQLANQ